MIYNSNANWRNWFLFLIYYFPWIHDQAALFVLNFNINTWKWIENGWNLFFNYSYINFNATHGRKNALSHNNGISFFSVCFEFIHAVLGRATWYFIQNIPKRPLWRKKKFCKNPYFEVHKQNNNCKFNLHQNSIEWSASSFWVGKAHRNSSWIKMLSFLKIQKTTMIREYKNFAHESIFSTSLKSWYDQYMRLHLLNVIETYLNLLTTVSSNISFEIIPF